MPSVRDLILQFAQQYQLDPAAVMAVARGEGGLGWGAVGDQGTSYGPFQLHRGGALPAGQGPEFANSPAGISYALRKMAESGAAGLTGGAAVNSIIRRFERPADPDSSVRNALARLGVSGDYGSAATPAQPSPSPLTREFAAPAEPSGAGRADFAAGLIGAIHGGKIDPQQLLGLVQARRAAQTPQLAAAPGQVTPSVPLAPTGGANQPASGTLPQGLDPAFAASINRLIADSGGKVWSVSGWRSTEHQQRLWDAALKKYGSVEAARKWVAPPGKSKHNLGMADDLGGDLNWAHQNAARYGIWFPMSWENWHAEPLGSR